MKTKHLTGDSAFNDALNLPSGMVSIDSEKKALRLHLEGVPGGYEVLGTQSVIPNSPGPQSLIGGDDMWGFYGEITSEQLIDGETLANEVGLSAGSPINSGTTWLKFNSNGKIIITPKLPIRAVMSWEELYQAGVVYGDDTVGYNPSGVDQLQNTLITVAGYTFRVRLFKGANSDPTTAGSGYDIADSHGSEWNRLMYRIQDDATAKHVSHDTSSEPIDRWALYNENELGVHQDDGFGTWAWCQETLSTDTGRRVRRGFYGVSYSSVGLVTASNLTNGWRPVLELVE